VTRTDPERQLLRAMSRELRWRPLTRRRLLVELAAHLEDSAADLRADGCSADEAAGEAARRLGEPELVAASFRSLRSDGWRKLPARRLRSPAWIAAGAMSVVTAWAAEVPQASGAKTTRSAVHAHRLPRPGGGRLVGPAVRTTRQAIRTTGKR
jgi:hypothetical protein